MSGFPVANSVLAFARRPGVNRTVTIFSIIAIFLIARSAAAGTSHPPAPKVPYKDRFAGQISHARGTFSGDHGRAAAYLQHRSGERGEITLRGRPCAGAGPRCLVLDGVLKGTLTPVHSNPDVGRGFTFSGSGTVSPLGAVMVQARIHGTGFITQGVESMTITMTRPGATIEFSAESGTVPGFTTP